MIFHIDKKTCVTCKKTERVNSIGLWWVMSDARTMGVPFFLAERRFHGGWRLKLNAKPSRAAIDAVKNLDHRAFMAATKGSK